MTGRRLFLLVALFCALAPGLSAEDARPSRGFDHGEHAERLERRGERALPCARCHPGSEGSRPAPPDHRACFGACHGEPPPARSARDRRREKPYRIEPERLSLCRTCHAPDALARLAAGTREPARPAYPPYAIAPEFGVRTAHEAHEDTSTCRGCHQVPADPGAPPRRALRPAHARCAGCHAGAASARPPMSECAGCHRRRAELAPAARRFPAKRFTHRAHLGRLEAGEECTSCHAWDRLAAGKASCRRCHDGESAFSMVTPLCRRCHTSPPPRRRGERPTQRFSHRRHRERGLSEPCQRCHALSESGAPMPASADHIPCADAGCHENDFAAPEPTTCGACHVGFEPWLDLHADRAPREATEFGARFSHRAHLGGERPRLEAACRRCHRQRDGDSRLRPPRDHRACTGKGCHAKESGAEPHLAECGGCHAPGLMAAHVLSRTEKRWSVRESFDHRAHQLEPENPKKEVPCLECHQGVMRASKLGEVPVPGKKTCARCHDGKAAFKLTGHGCARCHGS